MVRSRRFRSWVRRGGAAVALLSAVACSDSPVAPADDEARTLVLDQEALTVRSHQEVVRFSARVFDALGHEMAGVPLAWSVDAPGVLEPMGEGTFRTLADGTARITVRPAGPGSGGDDGRGPRATADVRVEQEATRLGLFVGESLVRTEEGYPSLTTLDLWTVDDRPALTARAVDAMGQAVEDGPVAAVTWTSGDPHVLTLAEDGTLVPVTDGTTTLFVQGEGLSGELAVRVRTTQEIRACLRVEDPAGSDPAGSAQACASVVLTFVRTP